MYNNVWIELDNEMSYNLIDKKAEISYQYHIRGSIKYIFNNFGKYEYMFKYYSDDIEKWVFKHVREDVEFKLIKDFITNPEIYMSDYISSNRNKKIDELLN